MRLSHLCLAAAGLAIATGLSAVRALSVDAGVDVALVIAGDVSGSMEPDEQRLQRDGFATAFRHPDVQRMIESGMTGRVAVTYVEWAGPGEHWVIAPWTIISNKTDAAAFATTVAAAPLVNGRQTSLSGGLVFAAAQFQILGTPAVRMTIDISGDGYNSAGAPLAAAREFVLNKAITVNGLTFPAATDQNRQNYSQYISFGSACDLEGYYQNCVIGGPGGFAMHIEKPAQFISVIRRKVALEIAALPAQVEYANYAVSSAPNSNCADYGAL